MGMCSLKDDYVLFKELSLIRKIMSNCILDLVIIRYMWEKNPNIIKTNL